MGQEQVSAERSGDASGRVVNSYNEWDPLEEIIVGVADGATVPEWHVSLMATTPEKHWPFFQRFGGQPFPADVISAANRDLDELVHILEAEGVKVVRPDIPRNVGPHRTPDWESPGGLYAAMPRDLLLVLGDEILETPMAWRSRYFEVHAYRRLIQDYFKRGCRWSAAPRPQLRDELFDETYEPSRPGEPIRYVINNDEPTFDAADFFRCGRDIFYILSQVTNELGIAWLERHVEGRFRLHRLECDDNKSMHIDTTFVPLAPGKLLVNPERFTRLPHVFDSWDILHAPPPCTSDNVELYMSGKWLSMNVLMLDQERVIVAKHEANLIESFKMWGFKPIPVSFVNFYRLGGSVHCATLDVRRTGGLQSYF